MSAEASWEDVAGPNIGGTYAAFEAARRAGVKRVIFASSNHAVGMHEVENVPAIYEPGCTDVPRADPRLKDFDAFEHLVALILCPMTVR